MSSAGPLLSVCIPAYNRPETLQVLLTSIAAQDFGDFNIVINDDCSPTDGVRDVALEARRTGRVPLVFHRNERTFGYDGNIRSLIERATGDYVVFMADDDVLCPGALARIAGVVSGNPEVGVVLRTWANVDRDTGAIAEEFRYFPADRFFPAGSATVATFFRRAVFISGLVVHRESALKYATARFDGTLLYQLHVVSNILLERNGYYIASLIACNRSTGVHFFGTSESEKGRFEPKVVRPEHSLQFVGGMMEIARVFESEHQRGTLNPILGDLAAYSYPLLAIQAKQRRSFFAYAWRLGRLGLWKSSFFWAYFLLLATFGPHITDRGIVLVKRFLGRTPLLGSVYTGQPR